MLRLRLWDRTVLRGSGVLVLLALGCGGVTPSTGTGGSSGNGGGAGSGGSPSDAAAEVAPVTVSEACSQVAHALCERIDSCSPTTLKLFYGDRATCATRAALGCMTDQGVAGTTRTPEDLVACAAALAPTGCAELLANHYPAACDIKPGTAINGTACGSDWQCMSSYCGKTDACGVCGPRQPAGGDCTVDGGCLKGLVCANKKCVAPGTMNADCSAVNQPCRADLYCATASSKCLAKVGAGGSCVDDQACDITKGVICFPANHTCEMITVGKAGDGCGLSSPNKALCVGFTGLGPAQDPCSNIVGNGICAKTAEDGTACGMDHKVCLAPANCVMGVCRLPSAPNCH
jgi:hypothetical protein